MSATDDLSAFWLAVRDGAGERVRSALVQHPEWANAIAPNGRSAITEAVSSLERSVDAVQALIDAGADVNWTDAEGYTPLHCALGADGHAQLNAPNIIQALVRAGARLEARQHYGWTPLLRAVVEGTLVEVQALLEAGADPNETMPPDTMPRFNAGRTTLMGAITHPHAEEVVKALLDAGADPRSRNRSGMDFFEYCSFVQTQSGAGAFSDKVGRCAQIARERKRLPP